MNKQRKITISLYDMEKIIKILNSALKVLNEVTFDVNEKDITKGAPYAVGFSKVSLESSLETLTSFTNYTSAKL